MYNFKWQPVSAGIKFERLGPLRPKPGELGSTGPSSAIAGGADKSTMDNGGSNGEFGNDQTFAGVKQVVNHLEFHQIVSEKASLFIEL